MNKPILKPTHNIDADLVDDILTLLWKRLDDKDKELIISQLDTHDVEYE